MRIDEMDAIDGYCKLEEVAAYDSNYRKLQQSFDARVCWYEKIGRCLSRYARQLSVNQ